jgi:hypothetical protein
MSKLSFSVFLNVYGDAASTNAPDLNNVKWNRYLSAIPVKNPTSQQAIVAPGENRQLFSGIRSLAQDGTTNYSIALKPLSTQTYILTAVSGTLPNFRTPRSIGSDATTQVTVSVNGPVVTFTSTGGTSFSLGSCQVGDFANIGNLFNSANQGSWQIIAKTSNSFSISNDIGVAEGPITLGAGFASQVQIFSADGVQVGDTLIISGGFSPASQGSYAVTAVYANSLEFYTTEVLPQEGPIQTQAIAIYSSAKQLVYLESDSPVHVIVNGVDIGVVKPIVINNTVSPGVFMLNSTVYSLSVNNAGLNPANIMLIAVE